MGTRDIPFGDDKREIGLDTWERILRKFRKFYGHVLAMGTLDIPFGDNEREVGLKNIGKILESCMVMFKQWELNVPFGEWKRGRFRYL